MDGNDDRQKYSKILTLEDLERIGELAKKGERKGLLAAIGAWEDFEGLDKVIKDIYLKRKRSEDRKADF